MYHTQERRRQKLTAPVKCIKNDAWLGEGYYFWKDEEFAIQWGHDFKRRTGYFEIYKAEIKSDRFFDAVYNEEQSDFFQKQIDKVAQKYIKRYGTRPEVDLICEYFNEKAEWTSEIDGILFHDMPEKKTILIKQFPYKKRVQAVVYNKNCIFDFRFHAEYQCVDIK